VASSRGGAWSPPPPLRAASFRPLGGSSSSSSSHDDGEDEEDEDLTHLTAEYRRLADGGDGVAFAAFLRSEEVQAILADDSTFLQDIAEIWMKYAGSDSAPVGLESFIAINREIDDLFEFVDDDDDGGGYGEPGDDEDGDVLRGEASMLMQEIQEEDPDGDDDFMGDDELGGSSRDTFFLSSARLNLFPTHAPQHTIPAPRRDDGPTDPRGGVHEAGGAAERQPAATGGHV
jgi:hypothetical protein